MNSGRGLGEGGVVDVQRVSPLPGRVRDRKEERRRVPSMDHATPGVVGDSDHQVSF